MFILREVVQSFFLIIKILLSGSAYVKSEDGQKRNIIWNFSHVFLFHSPNPLESPCAGIVVCFPHPQLSCVY